MNSLFAIDYSWLIPLLPLLGAAIAGFMGARWLKQQSHWPIWLGVGGSRRPAGPGPGAAGGGGAAPRHGVDQRLRAVRPGGGVGRHEAVRQRP